MRIKFTKLVCIGLGIILGSTSLIAQRRKELLIDYNRVYYSMMQQEVDFSQQEIQLRKDENKIPNILPDSIITYSAAGDKLSKKCIIDSDISHYTYELYTWNNNGWIINESRETFLPDNLYYLEYKSGGEYQHFLHLPKIGADNHLGGLLNRWFDMDGNEKIHPVKATYNKDGQVSTIEIFHTKVNSNNTGKIWLTYHFIYNKNGQLTTYLEYNHDADQKSSQYDYFYNEDGDIIQYESYYWSSEGQKRISEYYERQIAKYDSQGKRIREERFIGNSSLQKYLLNEYDIYYYSDGYTPEVEVDNNETIGNSNQGGFDIDINIPTDSINNGKITIILPDGFTLDEKNTTLTLDFAGLFDLEITKQEKKSWLIEINPKSTKSALLTSEAATKMLHVAYKVGETLKKGTYDISINNILFETPGGSFIPEPAITVPVNVNRWGVDNEYVEKDTGTIIFARDNVLHVQTMQTEMVAVYASGGVKLYEAKIQSGMTTINAANFPKGVLFVKGSSGWVKKIVLQ